MGELLDIRSVSTRYKFSLVACARWEHRDIVEWLLYHRSVGFDHIYLFSNDDDPTALLQAVMPVMICFPEFITFKHFPKCVPDGPQQQEIYRHFLDFYQTETEWFSFLDIDEFFVFRGINNVAVFMERFELKADAVYFNWLLYGHSGKAERDHESLLLSHTQRNFHIDPHTKILTRSSKVNTEEVLKGYYQQVLGFWHFWHGFSPSALRQINVLGHAMDGYSENFPERAGAYLTQEVSDNIISIAYIAHYQFRSEADIKRRVERGGSNSVPYWNDVYRTGAYKKILASRNKFWDTYLAAYWIGITSPVYNVRLESSGQGNQCNIALRKPTYQSSVFLSKNQSSTDGFSQGHVTKGWLSNTFGLRTNYELNPWFLLDLITEFHVAKIMIFADKSDNAGKTRFNSIVIERSMDRENWTEVMLIDDEGAARWNDEKQITISLIPSTCLRYIRVMAKSVSQIQFDEIEVYEEDATLSALQ